MHTPVSKKGNSRLPVLFRAVGILLLAFLFMLCLISSFFLSSSVASTCPREDMNECQLPPARGPTIDKVLIPSKSSLADQ